ncbi:MAG: hypothetical protein ABI778_06375 [Ignavibacteriota bacterium]
MNTRIALAMQKKLESVFFPLTRQPRRRYLSVIAFLFLAATTSFAQDLGSLSDVKPVSLDGSITLSGTKYSVAGAIPRRPPTSWTIVGTPTLSFYGISLPFNFILSDQESEFRQPFDQIGVSPNYKSLTLHLGYNSLNYSKYTLAGITFLGAGLDLDPEPLRLSVMYGRFQRAVEIDTSSAAKANYTYVQPAYKRMGFAAKVGYGSQTSFIDFIYLHAVDDSSSLKLRPDSLNIFPAENSVMGLNMRLAIVEQLALEAEGAVSFFTRDVRSPVLDSDNIPKSLQSIVNAKSSTSLLFANNVGLVFNVPHFSTRLGYERIEPDYNSMGAYYFTSDMENYTIAPAFDMLDNKIRASGSIGIQHDNILSTKLAKTNRVIGSVNLSINPAQVFGIDFNYTNYSTGQSATRLNTTPPDTGQFQVRNVSQSGSITPRVLLISTETTNSFILSLSQQHYTDLNIVTQAFANSQTTTGSFNYNLSFLKSGLNLGASLLYADTKQGMTTTGLRGLNVNASKSFLQNKLSLGGSFGFTNSAIKIPGIDYKTNTLNESLNSSYRIFTQGTLSLSIYATENSSSLAGSVPFTEIIATLSYSHNFSF